MRRSELFRLLAQGAAAAEALLEIPEEDLPTELASSDFLVGVEVAQRVFQKGLRAMTIPCMLGSTSGESAEAAEYRKRWMEETT
jgi:hypothetical protein